MDTRNFSKEQLEEKVLEFQHERDRVEEELSHLKLNLKNNEYRALVGELDHKHELSKGILTELSISLSRGIKEDFFRLITLAVWITTAIFAALGIIATFGGYLSLKDLIKNRITEQLDEETKHVERLLNAKFNIYETNVKDSIQKIEDTRDGLILAEHKAKTMMSDLKKSHHEMQQNMDLIIKKANESRSFIQDEMESFKEEGGLFKDQLKNYALQVKRYTDKMEATSFKTEQAINYITGFLLRPNSEQLQKWRGKQAAKKVVVIGSNVFDESRILCAIITKLLQRNKEVLGISQVIPKYDYGGPPLQFMGLIREKIDIYPSYTWSGFEMGLGPSLQLINSHLQKLDAAGAVNELNSLYNRGGNGFEWFVPLGFHNNWEIIMLRKRAEILDIQKISDLFRYQNTLSFGGEFEFFHREAGYNVLTHPAPYGYRLNFEKIVTYSHEKIYNVLDQQYADVVDGFSTDSQLSKKNEKEPSRYLRLKDDLNLFGKYYAALVARESFLQQYPKVKKVLQKLEHRITEDRMRMMLRDVNTLKTGPGLLSPVEAAEQIAEEFLIDLERF